MDIKHFFTKKSLEILTDNMIQDIEYFSTRSDINNVILKYDNELELNIERVSKNGVKILLNGENIVKD